LAERPTAPALGSPLTPAGFFGKGGFKVDLTPAERAVLRQVQDLFREASIRSYRLTLLTSRWPAMHHEAYRTGYDGLVKKGLLVESANQQLFGISDVGMKAMV
jgi:hypothetical protein